MNDSIIARASRLWIAIAAVLPLVGVTASHAAEEAAGTVEEVLVTARKVEESLQDTPVAITAVSAQQIDDFGLNSLADVAKLTAGLIFDDEFTRASNRPVIRGQANILGESGVAYFIDGVYISTPISDYDLGQVERIEVVKGPQSALYGRNTYSGAINIVTRSPGEEMGGQISAEIAEDGEYRIAASVSGPLSDRIAGGLSVRHYELNSPFTNVYDDSDIGEQESQSISGVLDIQASDQLNLRARAYYGERRDGQPAVTVTDPANNNCFTDNGGFYGGTGRYFCGTVAADEVNTDWPFQAPGAGLNDDNLQLSLKATWDINDQLTLTSITGHNKRDYSQLFDADYGSGSFHFPLATPNGFPARFIFPGAWAFVSTARNLPVDFTFANNSETDSWSQELQMAWTGDRFFGLLGFYHFDQDIHIADNRQISDAQMAQGQANFGAAVGRIRAACAANPACVAGVPLFGYNPSISRDQTWNGLKNTAVFGLASFDLTEQVRLSAEARYQDERVTLRFIDQALGGDAAPDLNAKASFDRFLPRVTLDWRPNDNHMLYLAYAQGTKPGGFNGSEAIESGIPTFDEEDANSIEIGAKNTLAGGQVVANVAAFFNEVEGYQLTQNVLSATGTPDSATVNAGDADIYGLEIELTARPEAMPGLTMMLNYAWTDAEFTAGVDQNEGVLLDVADDGLTNCSTGNQFPSLDRCNTGDAIFGSIEDRQIPRSAEHMLFADAEMRRSLGNGWGWFAGVSLSHESSKFAQVHNLAETGDTTLVNARIGFESDRYSLRLWGRNLTDEDSAANVTRYLDAGTYYRAFIAAPRRGTTFGVTLSANW